MDIRTVTDRRTKFSNGEISPSMYGDISHPKWLASLRTCKNWLPIPQGSLVNRPGTVRIAEVKDSTYAPRLIPFTFSDNQTYVLEFGDAYVRFYQNGKYVGTTGLNSGAYRELVTPFTKEMLPYLKFAQVGNTITICYGGQNPIASDAIPQDLKCTLNAVGGWPWTIGNTPLAIPNGAVTWGAGPTDATPPYQSTGATTGPAWNKGERCTVSDAVAPPNGPNLVEWICIQDNVQGSNKNPPAPAPNSTGEALQGSLWWMPAVDRSHPATKNLWRQTAVVQDANGITYESGPSPALTVNGSLSANRQRPIIPATPVLAAGYTLLHYRFYRAVPGGLYGWVADVATANLVNYPNCANNSQWIDNGNEPDYSQQPPDPTFNPFKVGSNIFNPGVVGYMDQRRMFASTTPYPMRIMLSKDADFYRWETYVPGADTDPITIDIAGEKLEQVRSFLAMRRGIVLTGQGEWTLSGSNGAGISRTGKELKWQSGWGSSWLNPIKIGTGLLFVTAKSNMVRDFYPLYGLYSDIWDGQDLSFMARHLFDNYQIVAWAFQSVPYPVVWGVRNDGKLLSVTYQHAPPSFGQQLAEGIVAWAWHDTGGSQADSFEEVCCVPEPPEDAVYFVVKRTVGGVVKRTIERMSNPVCPASPFVIGISDPRYGVYLDAAVQYDGHNTGATTMQLSGGSYNQTDHPTVTASTNQFAAADADPAAPSAVVFDPEGANVICPIVQYISATQVKVELPVALTAAQIAAWATATTTSWGLAKSKFTVAHLVDYAADTMNANAARGVSALVDGDTATISSWAGGAVTFDAPALVVCVGLSYNADVGLLDAHTANIDTRNVQKKLVRIGFEVGGARGLWAGEDYDKLWPWKQRSVADSYANVPLAVGYFEQEVTGSWNKDGRAVLRQIDPLPVVLTAALREFELGGT